MQMAITKKATSREFLFRFYKENIVFISLFLVFFAWQLYQALHPMWDQIVYSLQGKWFCGQPIYFEYLRPPFPGALNCLFGAGDLAPILSAALACVVFGYAVWLLGKKYVSAGVNPFVFFGLMFIFPMALFPSNGGWDIFALALGLLALTLENPFQKGFLFGLSTLTRYNYWLFLPAMLFSMDKKKWPAFFSIALLMWVPWLVYNYFQSGDALFSVKESILLNVYQKGSFLGFDLISILLMIFFIFPFIVSPDKKSLLEDPIHQFSILGLLMFLFSGNKEVRFLMPLISSQAILYSAMVKKRQWLDKLIRVGIIAVVLVILAFPFYALAVRPPEVVIPTSAELGNCRIASDRWIDFYQRGIIAGPTPPESEFEQLVQNGTTLVLFHKTFYSKQMLVSLGAIEFSNYFLIKPAGCAPRPIFYTLRVPMQ